MSKAKNQHDLFFRASMSNLKIAEEFFLAHLSPKVLTQIRLETLKPQSESFIDENLSEAISDILYSVEFQEKKGYLYLLCEHQSSPLRFMAFRLLRYVIRIMEHHLHNLGHHELPVVVPLVFYNGKRAYNEPLDIFQLFGEHEQLARQIFVQPFNLIDVSRISDQELRSRYWAGFMEYVMKHIYKRDLINYLKELPMHGRFQVMGLKAFEFFLESFANYVLRAGTLTVAEGEQFVKILQTEFSDGVEKMSMRRPRTYFEHCKVEFMRLGRKEGREMGRQEGIEKGIEKGLQQGVQKQNFTIAQRMLSMNFDLQTIASVTGLSLEDLITLQKSQLIVME